MTRQCGDCKCPVVPDSRPVDPVVSGPGLIALVADAPSGLEGLGRSYFDGAAGEVLEATIRGVVKAAGDPPLEDVLDEFAVFHAVARPTPGGKPPKIVAVRNCRERLMSELADATPRMVLSVGAAACASLSGTGKATPITKWRGMMRWLDLPDRSRVPWVATIAAGSVVAKTEYYRDLAADVWKSWVQAEPIPEPDVATHVPRDFDALRRSLALLDGASVVSCDVETTGLRPWADELLSVGFGADYGDGHGVAVIVPRDLLDDPRVRNLCWEAAYSRTRRTVTQNGQFDHGFLSRWLESPIPPEALLGDTLYLGSLLDERPRKDRIGSLGLKEQAMVRYDKADYHWSWDTFYADMRHDGTYPTSPADPRPAGYPTTPRTCDREKCKHPHPEDDHGDHPRDSYRYDGCPECVVDGPRADMEGLYRYHALDVYYTARLWFDLVDEAEAESSDIMRAHDEVVVPAMRVLSGCTLRGAPLDLAWLDAYAKRLRRRIDRRARALEAGAARLGAPEGFEMGSASQVADVMYDVWGMTPDVRKKKYKDGVLVEDRSTDKEHIEAAIAKYRRSSIGTGSILSSAVKGGNLGWRAAGWLRSLLRWRADAKQLSTYSETLVAQADDGARVHAGFLIHGTVTGRLSSEKPNLQNIPAVDDKWLDDQGRKVYQLRGDKKTYWPARRAFAPPPGYVIAEVDYGQLELRVAAALSGDERLKAVFVNGRDIHREVAATMFSKPAEEVTKPERYLAKAVDFGIIYGRQGKAISEGVEMDFYERELGGRRWDAATADAFVAKFLRGYPQLSAWLVSNAADALRNYYVETPFGRRRRFPFRPRTKWERMRIERQANNTPVQSSASDLCLQAMARIEPRLPEGAALIAPVHDSIVAEIREDLLADVERIFREEMEIEFMGVPLEVDFEVGPSWADVR